MATHGAMQRATPPGTKKDKKFLVSKPNGSPQALPIGPRRERENSFEDSLSQSIGSDGIKIGMGYEGDHIKMLRDRYNASKLRSEELSLTSTSLPVPLRVHGELAGRVYSAMATLLYASISISKIDDLERYIRKKATQLPRTIFDLDDWATVLNIARECRSAVPMPQIVKISDNNGLKKIKALEDKNVELINEVIKLKKVLSNSELLSEKQETLPNKSDKANIALENSTNEEIIDKLRIEIGQYKLMLADLESKHEARVKELIQRISILEEGTDPKNEFDDELKSKLASFNATVEKYEEEKGSLMLKIKSSDTTISKFEDEKQSLISQLQEMTAKWTSSCDETSEKAEQIQQLQAEIERIQTLSENNSSSMPSNSSQTVEVQPSPKESAEMMELQARCDALSSRNSDAEIELQKYRDIVQVKEQEYTSLQKSNESIVEECARYREVIKQLASENEENKQNVKSYMDRLEQMNIQLRLATVTGSSTEEENVNDSKVALLSQELDSAFNQINSLKSNASALETEYNAKVVDLKCFHEADMKNITADLAQIQSTLADTQMKLQQKDEEMLALKTEKDNAERIIREKDEEMLALKTEKDNAERIIREKDEEMLALKSGESNVELGAKERDEEMLALKTEKDNAELSLKEKDDILEMIRMSNDANVKRIKTLETELSVKSAQIATISADNSAKMSEQIDSLTQINNELIDKYNRLQALYEEQMATAESQRTTSRPMTPGPLTSASERPISGRPISGSYNVSSNLSSRTHRASYVSPSHRLHFSSESEVKEIRNQAATLIQSKVRGAISRERLRNRMRNEKAQEDGVLLAMPGTIQGDTGWYKGKDKIFYFCFYKGEYLLLCGPISEESYNSMLVEMQQATLQHRSTSGRPTLPKTYFKKDINIDNFALFATKRQIEQLVQEIKVLKSKKFEDPSTMTKLASLEKQNQDQKDEIKKLLSTNDQLMKNIDSLQSTFYKTGKQSNDKIVSITERPLMTRQTPITRHRTIIIDAIHSDQSLVHNAVVLTEKLQKIARGFIGRKKTQAIRRTLIARKAGVLLAMKKTVQGQDGWYEDPNGKIFYFVPHRGQWTVAAGPIKKSEFDVVWMNRRVAREGIEVLKQVNFNLRFMHEHIKGETYISSETGKMFIAVPVDLIIRQSHIVDEE